MPIIFPSNIVINLKIFRAQYKQTILHDYSALYIHLDYNVEQFGKNHLYQSNGSQFSAIIGNTINRSNYDSKLSKKP